jgi:hypothetical protein
VPFSRRHKRFGVGERERERKEELKDLIKNPSLDLWLAKSQPGKRTKNSIETFKLD